MPRPMKHSDVDWIGDIPADWDIVQLKRIAEIQTGNTPSKTENDKYYSQESGYLWIKAEDLGSIKPIASTTEYLTEDGIKYGRLFPPNTVYVCCIASVGKVGFCNISASCNQQINGLIFNNAYWKYGFFLTVAQESEYIINASGNVMKIINADKQARLMCPLPPLDEQQRIANFLDNECARIDSIVEKTRASIVEYKKLKQAIITRAVTKGMRPARTMKDSGIEWLGDIPADWELVPIKHLCSYNDEVLQENTDPDFTFDYIEIGSVEFGRGIIEMQRIRFADAPSRARRIVHENDIIVSTVRTYLKAVASIPHSDLPLIASTGFVVVRPRNVNHIFLKYAILSSTTISKIEANSVGISYPAINASQVVRFKIPVPSLDEQKEIASYLDGKTAAIDSLIEKKGRLVTELERLKKSLIFEYVTGKKEAPERT